jgi:hypothetical protein
VEDNIKMDLGELGYIDVDWIEMVRFQVLIATRMKITVFWDIARCSLVETNRRFRCAHCLHHQDD